jgi:hypothetical protein
MHSGVVYFILLLDKPERIYVTYVQQEFQTQHRLRDNSEIKFDALDRNIKKSYIVNFSVCKMSRSRLLYSLCLFMYDRVRYLNFTTILKY